MLVGDDLVTINAYCASNGGTVRCIDTDSKGRVLVAERDFSAGDVIYREPLLHTVSEEQHCRTFKQVQDLVGRCQPANVPWYWCALNSLTASDIDGFHTPSDLHTVEDSVQQLLLLLFTPSNCIAEKASDVTSQLVTSVFAACAKSPASATLLPKLALKVEQLLPKWKYNCFEDAEDDSPSSHVYFMSSFHNHDCNANSNWNDLGDGFLVLQACRDIRVGEELCISYLSSAELFESTVDRRLTLQTSKDFLCTCDRCIAPWDTCRGFRCSCGEIRYFSSDSVSEQRKTDISGVLPVSSQQFKIVSGCSNPSCSSEMSSKEISQLIAHEEELVKLYRGKVGNTKEVRFGLAKELIARAEKLFPEHWITERLLGWMVEGCSTRADAKAYSQKRLDFMRKAFTGANAATAWVMQDLAMWTVGDCGALQKTPAPTEETFNKVKASNAMDLFKEALTIFKNVNGTEDKYYLNITEKVEHIRAAAANVGVEL